MSTQPDFFADNFVWIFIILWVSVVYLISFLGGWYTLSEKYRCYGPYPKGLRWFGWHSGGFQWADYRSCLWIGPHTTGLFIRTGPWLLFRAGHPTLFIPWKEFEELKYHKFLFLKWGTLELAHSPRLTIYLWPGEAKQFEALQASMPTSEK